MLIALPQQPKPRVGERCRVDGTTVLIGHQNRHRLVLAVLWNFIPRDGRKQLLGLQGNGLQVRALSANIVAGIAAILDVEEVTRHGHLQAPST